jgi:membrane protease YdiL (CAAX protease family)
MGSGGRTVAAGGGGDQLVFAAGTLVLVAVALGMQAWQTRPGGGGVASGGRASPVAARHPSLVGGALGIGTIALLWTTGTRPATLGLSAPTVEEAALGLGLGLLLWGGVELLEVALDDWAFVFAPGTAAVQTVRSPDRGAEWVVLLGGVLPVVAVGEELLFRGALVGATAGAWSVPVALAVVASALAFGLYHRWQGRVGAAVVAAVGGVLAVGFVISGSLVVPAVAHYVLDAGKTVARSGLLTPLLEWALGA